MRPDIWERFQERFGVPAIREFYGATEGNAPLVNFTGKPGMVGRLMPGQVLVKADPETGEIQRNAEGFCERVDVGETGLLLGRIVGTLTFSGYVDEKATNKKVLTDIFERGDKYFDTGDLLTLHEDRWVSFADRMGDTFRWKGENVSTNEVAEILNGAPGVLESNVYGVEVPGSEGRAGMASINCNDEFDIEDFNAYVLEHLPVYQRPYFLRIQHEMRITGTFKHQKVDYRKEGYDPARVSDPLWFLGGDRYVPLDAELHQGIVSGSVKLR
jgi:acyl-CoA synthetase (AMP-forming)/AMP-acid ligase II